MTRDWNRAGVWDDQHDSADIAQVAEWLYTAILTDLPEALSADWLADYLAVKFGTMDDHAVFDVMRPMAIAWETAYRRQRLYEAENNGE